MPLVVRSSLAANAWVNSMGDGSAATPSLTFSNNATVGMYKVSNINTIAFASQGANVMTVSENSTLTVANVEAGPPSAPTAASFGPWTLRNTAADLGWAGVCWSPELSIFVAVSYSGTGNRVMSSPDGLAWTSRVSASDSGWECVAWVSSLNLFVALATNAIMTSPDAVTWTPRTSPLNVAWNSLAWSPSLGVLVAVASSGTGSRAMSSSDGLTWTARATPADNGWSDVEWSPQLGIFVAVASTGTGNRVMTSSNGTSWVLRSSPADYSWSGVSWSPTVGIFAAVSGNGAGTHAMSSADGVNWTLRSTPADLLWRRVLWVPDAGAFVAIAVTYPWQTQGNNIMYSSDGVTWTTQTGTSGVSIDQQWLELAYSPELRRIVVISDNGGSAHAMTADVLSALGTPISSPFGFRSNVRMYSGAANTVTFAGGNVQTLHLDPDTVRTDPKAVMSVGPWTAQTSAADISWYDIAWSPTLKLFAAVSYFGTTNRVQTSIDGITWVIRVTPNLDLLGIGWGNGLFVAVGTSAIVTSSDGITWTSRTVPAAINYRGVAWSPSLSIFAAVALTGTNNRVATSADGITWIARTPASNNDWIDIEWSPQLGLFAAVANTGTNTRVQTSVDGVNWVTRTTPDSDWRSIVWSAERGLFVVVGTGSLAMVSSNGITWTTRIVPNSLWVTVTWAPELGLFLAASYTSTTMYSYDGTSWTLWPGGPGNSWCGVAWSPSLNRFAVVSNSGTGNRVMTADGTLAKRGGNVSVSGVLTSANQPWGRGRFAAATAAAYIPLVSTQGIIGVTNSTQLFAPIPGRYMVGFQEIMNTSSMLNTVTIKVNGVDLVSTLSENTTTGYHYRNASTVVYLYSGDYVQFWLNTGTVFTGGSGEWANYYLMLI